MFLTHTTLILILCLHVCGTATDNKLFTYMYNFVSSTKYLGGHTDLVGGAVSFATEELGEQLKHHQILLGSCTVSMILVCITYMY